MRALWRLSVLLPALALSGGCSDYALHGEGDEKGGGGGGGGGDDGGGDAGGGEDSGGAGTDTGDGDGCTAATAAPGTVPIDDTCAPGDPWDVEVAWQWTHLGGGSPTQQVSTTPVVGRLMDRDGDGAVTDADPPVVVVVVYAEADYYFGELVVIDGETGAELWSRGGVRGMAGLALADIDANGTLDLVTIDETGHALALDGAGRELWTADRAVSDLLPSTQLAVADQDGDGIPEVLAHDLVLDGRTGAVELDGLGASSPGLIYWAPMAADLDGDGSQEILHGDNVYDATGALLWTSPVSASSAAWPVVTDVDGDAAGEVIYVGGGELVAMDPDGAEVQRTTLPATLPGPPCLADFDGDGASELALVAEDTLYQIELDGTVSWSVAVYEPSAFTGCVGADLDRDGAHEVVVADMDAVRILDGRTGATRFEDPAHSAFTQIEVPAVADVDGDGVAELVTTANDHALPGRTGVTVYASRDGVWPETWALWPGHAFSGTHIGPDGAVPASPTPSWLADDLLRAWPLEPSAGRANLWPDFVDVCVSGCGVDDTVEVTATISNGGAGDVVGPVELALYRDVDGDRAPLDVQTYGAGVAAGSSTESVRFLVAAEDAAGGSLVLVVDGADAVDECSEDDNLAVWTEVVCP